jgi:hypothetical protein
MQPMCWLTGKPFWTNVDPFRTQSSECLDFKLYVYFYYHYYYYYYYYSLQMGCTRWQWYNNTHKRKYKITNTNTHTSRHRITYNSDQDTAKRSGVRIPVKAEAFSPKTSRPAMMPTQPPSRWIQACFL